MLNYRRILVFIYDLITIPVAWLLAFWVRANFGHIPQALLHDFFRDLPVLVLIQAFCFWLFGLYRGQWRFASISDLVKIIKAVIVGTLVCLVFLYFASGVFHGYFAIPPRSIFPLYAVFLVFFLGGARLAVRAYREMRMHYGFKENALIVGSGQASEALIRELRRDKQKRYYPRVLVDDNKRKLGNEVLGIRVAGVVKDIPKLIKKFNITQILIAIPSANSQQMQQIVDACSKVNIPYRTLPGLSDLASGDVHISDLREVSLDDLLGRDPINLQDEELQHEFTHKTILVTGGGGSIGSELCRQIAMLQPSRLVIVDHAECNLYNIEMELKDKFPGVELIPCLQDVTDQQEVEFLLKTYQPNVVFHAAAYKHVPLLESQAFIAIRNNVLGTKIVAEASVKHNVSKFVLVSTDKAVNPTNIMGTTKRIAEIFCQNLNGQSKTNFVTVRFGNVLGSAGSVVPLFKKQLKKGGPITVTHPDITRFFMTIPEACQLILHASLLGSGGEIFVLDMGEPVKITYLAEQLIKLSGKVPGEDIEIKFTGLRPGEKLYEELFHEGEELVETKHEKISQSLSRQQEWKLVLSTVESLLSSTKEYQLNKAIAYLQELVPESQLETQKNIYNSDK